MSYLYLKARTQKQTSLHQGNGCEKFHRSIWFMRCFFFKVILNYTWQCSQRCARCNFSPWKPQWSCLGGIRREWIWKLEDTTLFRGVTHCSGLCARHKAEHGSERKRDNGKTSKKHWKPLAQQIECFFQIGFIIKHQGSLCIEQRLVSKNNFLWSLIGNRETKWTSENKSSSEDTLNLMKLNWWKLVKRSHFGHKHGLTMTLPRTVRSQGHRGQVNYFWGHVMCSVSTESGSRLKNQIEERVGLVNADGRPMMVLATTH